MLLKPRYVGRFRHVAGVLIRHGLGDLLDQLDLARFLPGHARARTTPEARLHLRARHLREALEELGATYIKLGQLLSTRPDIVPPAFVEELSRLQDNVAPIDSEAIRRTLAEELGRPVEAVFWELEETPIACASLSQVYRARLAPGARATGEATPQDRPPTGATRDSGEVREVAVKVLRPGVESEVELDLEILLEAARVVSRSTVGQRHDVDSLVSQLRRAMTDELDLRREALNADRLSAALAGFPALHVPVVIHELTTRRVLVAEYIRGSRIADAPVDAARAALGSELWRAYLKQILVDGVFHCDPHPGNFLLEPCGRIAILDHGMVAHLSRETQLQLFALMLALGDADGEAAAEACIELGIPGPRFSERTFKSEIGHMVARYAGRPLRELRLGRVFVEILETAFREDIRIAPELMLLGKTLLNLEEVCRRLDPNMDPVRAMRETSGTLLADRLRREATLERALALTLETRSFLLQVPRNLRRLVRRAASNDMRLSLRLEGGEELRAAIQKVASRITLGLITAALIVGSALLLNVRAEWTLWGYPVFGLVGFLLAAGLGIYLLAKIVLSDRY